VSITITQAKEHLSGQLHGGTLNRVRNIEALFERSANTLLSKIDPIDTIRNAPLTQFVHDDVYNYSLPSDFRKIIDLYPQADRQNSDTATRSYLERFDLRKALTNKNVAIEASEGTKILRCNWRSRQGKVFSTMNDTDDNGTWSAVGTASGIVQDTITKYSGSGSVRFDIAASGDGIQNTTLSAVDLTDEDEVADVFIPIYIRDTTDLARLTSITAIWGNDLTAKYWTGVAQTAQFDGSAFKVGWNIIKVPWSTATETGTVAPATTDSCKLTFATTGTLTDVRVDNIIFSIGRAFDIKYYSKFIIKNSSGTWITRTTSDDDIVVLDNDAIQLWILETLIAAAQQLEGTDSGFDIGWAKRELLGEDLRDKTGLYAKYRAEYPSQAKKAITSYGSRNVIRSRG
jgi:hypothetical protein